ncbi:PREDICTED: uncharacterized protein LOC109157808 [Ipomoea nil]|uniref:uncharacterized protein LOC109157808 n=1 Tax=Ipomoea nil TaxID=35883 RepID=UPI000901F1B2|nr:PREDICTED: uncharacterized protein LOC109157808 [Ipomoea nil]
MATRSRSEVLILALSAQVCPTEPTCYTQAVKHGEWRKAMDEELNPLLQNETWCLVPSQSAISSGWVVKQLDVHNAFLNGKLSETVYMKQPPGYIDKQFPNHVCLLKRSLYGLKQAPRAWFNRLHAFLMSAGFKASKTYVSLFYYSQDSSFIYILVYVDDILVMGNDQNLISILLAELSSKFNIRDLGEPGFFHGVETVECDDGILFSQQRYMTDILKHAGMTDCKSLATLISVSKSTVFNADLYDDATQYMSLVGTLQYLTVTRPDLSFAVNQLCQHMHAPTVSHWEQLKRVLRYVKGTITYGLRIRKSVSRDLHAFSDSDWAGCPEDRKSTSGYAIFLGSNIISWVCKKQRIVARSSTKPEYKALAYVCAEKLIITLLETELQMEIYRLILFRLRTN